MATNENKPGIPKKPDIEAVAKLMGTCIPNWFPKAFKKNKKSAPISNLITPCPINLTGFTGAPRNKSNKIQPPKMEITTIGSNKKNPPLSKLVLSIYEIEAQKIP